MKRPPTVWVTQILLMMFAVLWLGVLLLNLATVPRSIGRGAPIVSVAVGVAIILSFVIVLLASFWGLAKKKMYGRWLGLVSLVFLWVLFIIIQYFPPAGPYKYYEFDNPAQLFGAAVFQVCVHTLFLVLILRLSFARKVVEFFRGEIESA